MKLTLFFLIFCSIFCQAQNETVKEVDAKSDTLQDVFHYAVFSGCEKFIGDDSRLYSCFAEKLNVLIGDKISPAMDKYMKMKNFKTKLKGKVFYTILKTGKLEYKSITIDDKKFEELVIPLLKELFDSITVEPGTKNGKPTNMSGQVPLRIAYN